MSDMDVRELRVKKGFSQEGLAQISGIGLRTIQRIENGEVSPRRSTLEQLAVALGVDTFNEVPETNNHAIHLKRINLIAALLMIHPLIGLLFHAVSYAINNRLNKKSLRFLSNLLIVDVLYTLIIGGSIIIYIGHKTRSIVSVGDVSPDLVPQINELIFIFAPIYLIRILLAFLLNRKLKNHSIPKIFF